MTARLTFLNWCAAGVIALVLSVAWLLDVPSEVQLRIDTIRTNLEAQEQDAKLAEQEAHFAQAAQDICTKNGAWTRDGNTLQCFTHRGHRTIVTRVSK